MTAATRYSLLLKGKITKEQFLYEMRKDESVPFITPLTSFNDAVTMLKQRRIVVENFEAPITETSNEDPYMQGFMAGERGEEYQDCPYMQDEDPEAYELWTDGYSDASAGDDSHVEDSSLEDFYDKQANDYETNTANSEMSKHDSEMYMESAPSLKEQVKEFVQKAMEGGSSMDEAKEQAKEYFSTEKAAFDEGKDSEHSQKADKALDASLSNFLNKVHKDTPQDKISDKHKAAMNREGAQPGAAELDKAIRDGKVDPKKIEDAAKKAERGDATELALLMVNAMAGLGGLNEATKPKLGIDQVNPYELKKGTDYEMGYATQAAPSWAEASLMNIAGDFAKAQAKALKNLNKDPMYYTRLEANSGKKEKKEKVVKTVWDGYTLGKLAAEDKANVGTKKEGPVKTPGVKVMKEGIKTSVQKIREFVSAQLKKETATAKTTDAVHNQDVLRKINTVPNPTAKKELGNAFNAGKAIDL